MWASLWDVVAMRQPDTGGLLPPGGDRGPDQVPRGLVQCSSPAAGHGRTMCHNV